MLITKYQSIVSLCFIHDCNFVKDSTFERALLIMSWQKCYKKMVLIRHVYKTPSSPHLLTSFTSTKKKIFFKKVRNNADFPHKFAEGNFTLLWVLFTDPSSDWSYLYIWKRERANGNVKGQYHKDFKTVLGNSFPLRCLKVMQMI